MKTTRRKIVYALMLIAVGLSMAYGGSENRRGTAGALELLLPVGARSSALSGSLNSSITGVEAINWNPAGVGREQFTEAMFSTFNYIADIKMSFAGVAVNFGGTGTFGISMRMMDFGDIPITTVNLPEGTGGYFSPRYVTFGITYSNRFTERISGGATLKYVSESVMRTSATGIAFDIGIQYLSSSGISLGVVLKNLGPSMKYDGNDLEFYSTIPVQEPGSANRPLRLEGSEFELPSTLEIGIGYDLKLAEQHIIGFNGNFQNSNFGSDEFRMGVEYGWNNLIFLRGGYSQTSTQSNYIYGPSFGVGVKIPVGATTAVTCDYAYRVVDRFDANQWLTLKLSL
jgi:hypothetical protein